MLPADSRGPAATMPPAEDAGTNHRPSPEIPSSASSHRMILANGGLTARPTAADDTLTRRFLPGLVSIAIAERRAIAPLPETGRTIARGSTAMIAPTRTPETDG